MTDTPMYDTFQPQNTEKTLGPSPSKGQPGVATAFDHLEFAQNAVQDAVRGLIDRLGVILQPEEPTDAHALNGGTPGLPLSDMARLVHDHADRLETFASYVRSVSARVDI